MQNTLFTRFVAYKTTLPRWGKVQTLSPLQILSIGIVAVVLLPVVYLVLRAVSAEGELVNGRTLTVVWNSVTLTAAVVGASVLIGVPFAWLTTRSNLPFKRVWLILGMLPLVIPSYIGTIALLAMFSPRGILQGWLESLGVDRLPPIYGFFGAWLALTLFTYPYILLPVRAALMNMDGALEEAAQSMGMSRWKVFRYVILPQLRPALATGTVLAGLYTLSDFGAVSLMRYDAFTRVIYMEYTNSFDRVRAAALALVLVVLTLALLGLERKITTTRNYRAGVGVNRQAKTVVLGRWRVPALAFCAVIVTLGVVIPVGVLASWMLLAGRIQPNLVQVSANSLWASGLAALVIGVLALPLGILSARHPSWFNRGVVNLGYLGNVLPGIVVALALVFFTANYLPGVYQTLSVLILGYATRFLPLSIGATNSTLTQINPRLDEAGRCLGLTPWGVVRRVTIPLARRGILAGMALVFLSAMKELPTTLLLAPTGYKTLATTVWSAHHQGQFTEVGAPALLLIALSGVSLYFILSGDKQ